VPWARLRTVVESGILWRVTADSHGCLRGFRRDPADEQDHRVEDFPAAVLCRRPHSPPEQLPHSRGGILLRQGVRLAIDPGNARIGVAASDPSGMLASPVETIARGRGDVQHIALLVLEKEAREVVVGYPASLSGQEGPAARSAREFANTLARLLDPVPVRLVDERLTTVTAQGQLLSGASFGKKGAKGGRARRSVIDQAAATVLLQSALDQERSTGHPPGEIVRASQGDS
jgi:putative Holliday junction resolvase